eukprot:SAG25_NODE_238_length_11236_cov_37.046061_11_plen_82_part_00
MLSSQLDFIMIPAALLDSATPGWALSSVLVSPAKLLGRAASWSAEGEGACWSCRRRRGAGRWVRVRTCSGEQPNSALILGE